MSIPLHDRGLIPDPSGSLTSDAESSEEEPPERESWRLMLVGVLFLVVAVFLAVAGAPFLILLAFVLAGVGFIFFYVWSKEEEVDDHYRNLVKQNEADERRRDEVTQTVRATLRGTVKVRCRYCEMLNEERAEKCESCGAPL